MSRIVAGQFDNAIDGDAAIAALHKQGFRSGEYESFYVPPPGQHAAYPLGGDSASDAGSRTAGRGAVAGALIGAATGVVIAALLTSASNIVAILIAGGLGAYVGSFAGTLSRLRFASKRESTIAHPVEIPAGRMVAINVDRPEMEPRAVEILRKHGARGLGRTEGTWRDGSWRDFDPRSPLGAL